MFQQKMFLLFSLRSIYVILNDDQNYKLKLYHNQRGGKKKEKRNRFAKKI